MVTSGVAFSSILFAVSSMTVGAILIDCSKSGSDRSCVFELLNCVQGVSPTYPILHETVSYIKG